MQLDLTPESWYLTKFYTHRALRCYTPLSFGIQRQSIFHEEISQIFIGIDNADSLYDDIIVYGNMQLELVELVYKTHRQSTYNHGVISLGQNKTSLLYMTR